MKNIYLGLLINLLSTAIHAQGVSFEWARSTGGTSTDFGTSITTDASGNVFVTGYYRGTVDFDPGTGTVNLTSNGSSDVFIQKLDTGGTFIWANSMGGTSADQGQSIITDASGNLYTTGSFIGTADF
ncbi:MAG: SBBP repeat-containing protein [Bacteroidetes bacterium]|nr:SBBP repeat-containing protein [Bacteroidota bacterium]